MRLTNGGKSTFNNFIRLEAEEGQQQTVQAKVVCPFTVKSGGKLKQIQVWKWKNNQKN